MSTHNICFAEAILMSTHNICFCLGDSNEYPQHMFLWRNKQKYPQIPSLSVPLLTGDPQHYGLWNFTSALTKHCHAITRTNLLFETRHATTISLHPDHTTISVHPDHTTISVHQDHTTISVHPDHTTVSVHPDHITISVYPNHTTISTSRTYYNKCTSRS